MVDSNDGSNEHLNMVLFDSNLDEVRWVKLVCSNVEWSVDIEHRPGSSRTDSASGSCGDGCDVMSFDGKKVVILLKVESLLLSHEVFTLEIWGVDSHILKEYKMSLSLK